MSAIPDGHVWLDDEGGIMQAHFWHRWFAWRPVWLEDCGWIWLRTVERRFTSRSTPERLTIRARYRMVGTPIPQPGE